MDLKLFYNERIDTASVQEQICIKKEKRISLSRLLIAIIALVVFYNLFSVNIYLAIAVLALFIILFAYVVKMDSTNNSKKIYAGTLRMINENELKCLDGHFDNYPDGNEYYDKNHTYTSDLDIFGKFSIFQYLNRTTLKVSRDKLAAWLKAPARVDEIKSRQDAVKELKDKIDLRQKVFAAGLIHKADENTHAKILEWLKESPVLLCKKSLLIICTVLPVLTILAYIFLNITFPLILLLIQVIIIIMNNKNVKITHDKVSRNINLFRVYSEMILLLESDNFTSEKLIALQTNFISDKDKASLIIKSLSKILNMLDVRLNIYIHVFLNTLFFWDIHQVVRLEKWKMKHFADAEKWFESIGEFEALSSLANMSFNNPEWTFPGLSESHFILNAKHIGHPLILKEKRVCNDVEINAAAKLLLITGSNMSGKSTFLRTIGVNIVLAMSGSCVTADEFLVSPVKVLTSIRNVDSLEEDTSTFYAELKKLEIIIKAVGQNEKVFILLDEIFKGTNSYDKHAGSVALIRKLINDSAVGIIASHDVELSQLSLKMPTNIENYNFDVHVENDEMFFNYKLNPGICKSRNASLLLKKIGINI